LLGGLDLCSPEGAREAEQKADFANASQSLDLIREFVPAEGNISLRPTPYRRIKKLNWSAFG
jgi:hypothetical protein